MKNWTHFHPRILILQVLLPFLLALLLHIVKLRNLVLVKILDDYHLFFLLQVKEGFLNDSQLVLNESHRTLHRTLLTQLYSFSLINFVNLQAQKHLKEFYFALSR